jgi:outer membrane lipoprotein-sorting protein
MSIPLSDFQNYPPLPRSYTSLSIPSSKHQTPLKSPSPDQSRMNSITPTKVKYIADGKNVRGYDFDN